MISEGRIIFCWICFLMGYDSEAIISFPFRNYLLSFYYTNYNAVLCNPAQNMFNAPL